jgi:hypothetical protein
LLLFGCCLNLFALPKKGASFAARFAYGHLIRRPQCPARTRLKNPPKKTVIEASKSSSTNASPARREYKPINDAWSFGELPFVYRPKRGSKGASNWDVPLASDYGDACHIGREYAGHYLQYIKDNPQVSESNMLGAIARDIDFKDASDSTGYWVGFFSYLERILCAQVRHMNIFEDIDRVNSVYAKIIAKRAPQK